MADFEPFEFISTGSKGGGPQMFDEFRHTNSGKTVDMNLQFVAALRDKHPVLTVTTIPATNVSLLTFAAAGYATADLDTKTDSILRLRGFSASIKDEHGVLAEARFFAKYHYKWANEDFILYIVAMGYTTYQYVLKEPRGDETPLDNSAIVDKLIKAIGEWMLTLRNQLDYVYVFDGYWRTDRALYKEVMKASWDKVILDEGMKKDLVDVSGNFFDSKETYEDFGVPWKRGLIFHGPPGNGKTISIKALMHTLYQRDPKIPSLYVKSATNTYALRNVFSMARALAPCLLILEDVETIVTPSTRSYFFNEVDGLENNDGILMVASTNYLERLDPGLTKRPSRFDRKYFFPIPNKAERILYVAYWRDRLRAKPAIEFPKQLVIPIAGIMDGFSFAYMQEAFVATLLTLAREEDASVEDDNDPLDHYRFWVIMKQQVKILRDQLDKRSTTMCPEPQAVEDYQGVSSNNPDPLQLSQNNFAQSSSDETRVPFGISFTQPDQAQSEFPRGLWHYDGVKSPRNEVYHLFSSETGPQVPIPLQHGAENAGMAGSAAGSFDMSALTDFLRTPGNASS